MSQPENKMRREGASLINTDSESYRAALARKQARAAREERIATLETNLRKAMDELTEIKGMLKCLLAAAKN